MGPSASEPIHNTTHTALGQQTCCRSTDSSKNIWLQTKMANVVEAVKQQCFQELLRSKVCGPSLLWSWPADVVWVTVWWDRGDVPLKQRSVVFWFDNYYDCFVFVIVKSLWRNTRLSKRGCLSRLYIMQLPTWKQTFKRTVFDVLDASLKWICKCRRPAKGQMGRRETNQETRKQVYLHLTTKLRSLSHFVCYCIIISWCC